ncbi:MAG TPA: response regulator, partial [Planctomycetota bacterium]|nr:response regulator [Planctomycetota bacterium]
KSPVPAVAPTSAPAAEEESFDFLADEGDQAQPTATSDSTAASHPGEFDFGILMEDDPVATESEVAAPAAAAATMSPTLVPVLKSATVTAQDSGIDAAVLEVFAQEAAELLDGMDRWALELERGHDAGPRLRELFRAYHTFKGSANTVGLNALGAIAHHVEDGLVELDAARAGALRRPLAALLLRVQRNLRQALNGPLPDTTWLDEAITNLGAATDVADGEQPATTNRAPLESADQDDAAPAEKRSLRVAAEQLDHLMDLTGELVIGRSRLGARVAALSTMQRDLHASRNRLTATIDGFRERYEFSGLDGRSRATPRWLGAGATLTLPADGDPYAAHFTDLELDRYEDIHVLARSLGEIGNDIGDLQGQIQRAIGDLGDDADAFNKVIGGIQGEIARARMVPVEQLFTRLRLAARDAAERESKGVQVTTQGEDVALDRAIADGIHVPLLHLVRNAVAHGIEAAEMRLVDGKRADGNITLSARQEGGQIVLEVRDDGAGLDLNAFYRRGVERGLILHTTPLDSESVRQLVFAPGLSTSAQADAVAGRGVGCDVARREIQRLGGSLRVTSMRGQGTSFSIILPLTLAITRALLVRERGMLVAVPMNFVERVLDLEQVRTSRSGGVVRVTYGDMQLPLIDLGVALGLGQPGALRGPALVLRLGEGRWALRVSTLLNQEDIVVKSLGDLLTGHPLFSGVTISGAGRLVPIIDVPGLLAPDATYAALAATPVEVLAPERSTRSTSRRASGTTRVLFVDDSLSVRRVAENHLRTLGVEVVLAVDGEDALARLRQERFDLIFTDLEMPRMHGYDLIREVRFIPDYRELPIVVVTSRSGDKHRAAAEAAGASDYLTKPFTLETLGAAVTRWVHQS